MSRTDAEVSPAYRELSPWRLWRDGSRGQKLCLFGGWLVLLVLCVALGVGMVIWRWSGIPLEFGGVTVYLTVYPTLLICLLLTLTLGWWWGALPAYCATLTLALYAGMPLAWALLFALSNPLGLAIMAIGYQAIAMRRDLRGISAMLFYVQLSFVACVFSSAGALIWSYTNHYERAALLPIWQGWWLGAFLQSVLLAGPAMALLWPRVERWLNAHPQLMRKMHTNSRQAVLGLLASVTLGVLVYGFVTIELADQQAHLTTLAHAMNVMRQTMWIFYWVFVAIVLFIAFFGYQLFAHWQQSQDRLLAELEKLATTDGLTDLLNRRAADLRLKAEWQRTRRSRHSAAMVLLDIDHFKQINDSYGHPGGDAALRHLANVMRSVMREVDFAARYGGEEFLIVLPDTGEHGAYAFAERLRQQVAATPAQFGAQAIAMKISLGVAVVRDDDASYERWFSRADRALYCAKQGGRNRTSLDDTR
ncbi:sensor domain-containing diguanylate cyclase [Duganella guangzhouensis]|uniref:sensor domain-containing diguanylate cyclase n=1 Tax=Duganella guangzhouensis TaxID=2666084 RepID=UPI001E44D1BD|nr:diguanylate cyclase [Duganella guangzhouensis]